MARKAMKKTTAKKMPGKMPAKKKTASRAKKAAPAPSKPVRVTTPTGKTITASALLLAIADHNGVKKTEAKAFIEGYFDVVRAHVLKGVKVKIGDLGMILIRQRKARMGRNPQTGEPVKIKASKKLAFRQSAVMKAAVMGR